MKKHQTQSNRQLRRRGFTLLEVLLVLAILGVLAAMVVPRLIGQQQGAMINTTKASIHLLENTLELYAVDHDATFPDTLQDLVTPVDRDENPMQPYLKSLPKDAWGVLINYELDTDPNLGTGIPKIYSYGPNGEDDDGSGDDINNWDERLAE